MKKRIIELLRFFFLYVGIVLFCKIVIEVPFYTFLADNGSGYRDTLLPFPVMAKYIAFLPDESLDKIQQDNPTKYYVLGIVANIVTFISSLYLVLSKRIRINKWILLFVMMNILVMGLFLFSRSHIS